MKNNNTLISKAAKTLIKLCTVSLFALATTGAHAGLIADIAIESNTGWNTNGWYNPVGGFFTQDLGPLTEGGLSTHSNGSITSHNDVSQGAHTLQVGTYTISFAAGNFNNAQFPLMEIVFAGMNIEEAASSSALTPGSGHWELWSFTWDVAANNVNIGNMLSFHNYATNGTGNASLDGVGAMSDLGNGFLVDYSDGAGINAVPEPTTLAIFALGMIGLASRRFKKQS